MKLVLSSLLAMAVVVKSKLAVEYIRTKAVGLNTRPAYLTASQITRNQSVLSCARKCSQNQACLSFLHGNDECELFDARVHPWEIKSVKDAPGFNYYYMMKRCSSCPDQRPNQEEYRELNGRRIAYKVCNKPMGIYYAMVACACQDGRLAAIVDKETNDKVQSLANKAGFNGLFWIGLSGMVAKTKKQHDLLRTDGVRITKTTSGVDQNYQNWYGDNPTYDTEAGIAMNSADGLWLDYNWAKPYPYVCEFV